jgi:hypothetical protein
MLFKYCDDQQMPCLTEDFIKILQYAVMKGKRFGGDWWENLLLQPNYITKSH